MLFPPLNVKETVRGVWVGTMERALEVALEVPPPPAVPEPSFLLRQPLVGEMWCAEHRPVHESTAVLRLPKLMTDEEIDMILTARGPPSPPRKHPMLRGTNTGLAAVHDVAESDVHRKLYLHRGGHFSQEWPARVKAIFARHGDVAFCPKPLSTSEAPLSTL